MSLLVTTDVQNGTVADAGVMNGNFSAIKAVVNGSIDNSNISASAAIAVSKLAPGNNLQVLTTVAGIPAWADAASGGSSTVPIGAGMDYYGATAPTGWLFCDGSSVSRTTYSALFAIIGTAYGAGDGSTTFTLPDKRGRVSVGKGTHTSVDTLGDSDGLAVANRRPQHRHTPHVHVTSYSSPGGTANVYGDVAPGAAPVGTVTSGSADGGSGNANDPLDGPAHLVCNSIIYAGV